MDWERWGEKTAGGVSGDGWTHGCWLGGGRYERRERWKLTGGGKHGRRRKMAGISLEMEAGLRRGSWELAEIWGRV